MGLQSFNDIIDLGIEKEKLSVAIYTFLKEKNKDKRAKHLFESLIQFEKKHIDFLFKLCKEKKEIDLTYHLDQVPDLDLDKTSQTDIIKFAIEREKDAIDFYMDLNQKYGKDHKYIFKRLANEEQRHKKQLEDLLDCYNNI